MFLMMWCVTATMLLLVAISWLYLHQVYSKFPYLKHDRPVPLLGNMTRILFCRENLADHVKRLYDAFPNERFIGRYQFTQPMVLIRDIELIKQIGIKDFDNFIDRSLSVTEDCDPFFGKNLIALKGQKWKDMRTALSPAFTSSKIRHMVPFMVEVGEQMIKFLKKKESESDVGNDDRDIKDISFRYVNDVIASCAFGLKVDSYMEEKNQFHTMAQKVIKMNFKRLIMLTVITVVPAITKFLKFEIFSKPSKNFFRYLVTKAIKEREENNIFRPDMIHILMEVKKVTKWTEDDLLAQAMIFFAAGFETMSTAISFVLHSLAFHSEIQDRLAQEIKENDARRDGKCDYNSLQNMVYLDMVISESLRLYPPAVLLDRVCINDYHIGKPNSKSTKDFIIRKGMIIGIPVWGIHRDPQYYPEPLKFDPERFSEENKHKIQPTMYMPFGIGPRTCIGARFALYVIKVMIYHLLLHFEVSPCAKSNTSGKLGHSSISIELKGGHWARLSRRK